MLWVDYEQALEDKLVKDRLAATRATRRLLTRDEFSLIQDRIEL